MKKLLLNSKSLVIAFVMASLFLLSSTAVFAVDYYSFGNAAPNTLANWWTNTNGTGSHPANFTTAGNKFIIQSGSTMTTTGNWTVSGAGSTIQINTGGILVASNAVTATVMTVASGATYRHNQNGGAVPTATWTAGSTCEITGVTNTLPTGVTQSFSNFTWNCAGQTGNAFPTTINITGNLTIANSNTQECRPTDGSAHTVGGNYIHSGGIVRWGRNSATSLTVTGAVNISGGEVRLSTGTANGTLNVAGDFTVGASGTLTETGTATGSGVVLNGTASQAVSIAGTVSNNVNVTLNNATGATLNSSVTLPGTLTLTSGKLTIATGNTLTISGTAAIGGTPGAAKYIVTDVNTSTGAQGFLSVINIPANTSYLFPIGDASNYLPATLTPSAATTTANNDFTLCAFPGVTTNGAPNGTAFTAGQKTRVVDAVWTINYLGTGTPIQGAGSTSITVAWPAALEGSLFTANTNSLIGIAHWDGPSWGTCVGTGDNTANTATRTNVTTFSPFGVGTISAGGGPLPIKVNYFNAAKGNGYNTLNWSAESTSEQATFDVERSVDGKNFTSINTVVASRLEMQQAFTYVDNSILSGTVYYRIKITDFNGKVTYTSVVRIAAAVNDMKLVAVLPNPVSNTAQLNVVSAKKDNVQLSVVSMTGQLVQRSTVQLQSGSSIINLDVANLQSGMYTIKGTFSDGTVSTVKFVKQ